MSELTSKTLAPIVIIGAGPKAAAICTKACALSKLGLQVPSIIVVDKGRKAEHWRGTGGYTDGSPRLGTPPEKDVGFPYRNDTWNPYKLSVSEAMEEYSWKSHLLNQPAGAKAYAEWIDRGRPSPTHSEWSDYIAWTMDRCGQSFELIENSPVKAVRYQGADSWVVDLGHRQIDASKIVITGPGEPIAINVSLQGEKDRVVNDRMMDGKDFWQRRSKLRSESSFVVIGGGETAAAIAVALARDPANIVRVVNPYGVFYSRGESYTENALYSSADSWQSLTPADRREIMRRTDRGVFSLTAQRELNVARNVVPVPGKVTNVLVTSDYVEVNCNYHGTTSTIRTDYAINAIGFSPLTFMKMFDDDLLKIFVKSCQVEITTPEQVFTDRSLQQKIQETLENRIGADLCVENWAPSLCLPGLAGFKQGPGFANLSALGDLADRVLGPTISQLNPSPNSDSSSQNQKNVIASGLTSVE